LGEDPECKDAAVRALSRWKEERALGEVIKVAQQIDDPRYNALLLRGVAHMLQVSRTPHSKLLPYYDAARAASRRSEERSLFEVKAEVPPKK
jgi:hypothetical protein